MVSNSMEIKAVEEKAVGPWKEAWRSLKKVKLLLLEQ